MEYRTYAMGGSDHISYFLPGLHVTIYPLTYVIIADGQLWARILYSLVGVRIQITNIIVNVLISLLNSVYKQHHHSLGREKHALQETRNLY